MLEVIIPGIRHGDGVAGDAITYRGMICYISGINADGKPVLKVPTSSAQAWGAVYPVDKIYYGADYSDTASALELIPIGADIIYYEGGEYETTQWYPSSFGLTASYWAAFDGVSSSYGSHINQTGFSTTLATLTGLNYRCYPLAIKSKFYSQYCLGTLGAKQGMIAGHHSAAGYIARGTTIDLQANQFAYALGIHGSSSADARLRFRILPNAIGRTAIGGVAADTV